MYLKLENITVWRLIKHETQSHCKFVVFLCTYVVKSVFKSITWHIVQLGTVYFISQRERHNVIVRDNISLQQKTIAYFINAIEINIQLCQWKIINLQSPLKTQKIFALLIMIKLQKSYIILDGITYYIMIIHLWWELPRKILQHLQLEKCTFVLKLYSNLKKRTFALKLYSKYLP